MSFPNEIIGKLFTVTNEFISFEHYGFIMGGKELTDTPEVLAWAPSHENYTFVEVEGGTKVLIELEVSKEWEEMMASAWPKALVKLKEICEA